MDPLKICHVTAELAPYAKVGGLGDVSGALPRHSSRLGHDVRVFMPLYLDINATREDFQPVPAVQDVTLRIGNHPYHFSLYTIPQPDDDHLSIYCVHCPALYERHGIYTDDPDEAQRFLLLSRAAIESCQYLGFAPDVFHVHDWQTALVPLFLRTQYAWDKLFSGSKTLLSIHNLGYQGVFSANRLAEMGARRWSPPLRSGGIWRRDASASSRRV